MRATMFTCDQCGHTAAAQELPGGNAGLPVGWLTIDVKQARPEQGLERARAHACNWGCAQAYVERTLDLAEEA